MKEQDTVEKLNTASENALSLFLKTGLQFLTGVYVFLILCVMPLYFTDGYAHIGRDKYAFFYQVTTKVGALFAVLLGCMLGQKFFRRGKERGAVGAGSPKVLSLTDKFALGYAAAVLLSYFFSPYREGGVYADAWYGTEGWFMGAFTQLLFVGIYFAVSRFWKAGKWQGIIWLAVTFCIFVLGILNRFGVYPISMRGAGPEFISTIGNINWYCSYLVLVLFAGMYCVWAAEKGGKRTKLLMLLWLTAGLGALLTQGSLSGLFTLGVMLLVIYMCSVHSMQRAEAFAKCLICLGGAATIVYVLRLLFGARYNYPDTISDLLINTPLALLPLGVGLLMWFFLRRCYSQNKTCEKGLVKIGYVLCGVAGLVTIVYIILTTLNTLRPGSLGAFSEVSLFTFDGAWGSNRGISWAVGWECFREQDLWSKIVGIGPDTMAEYLYKGNHTERLAALQEIFGNFRLTNAHNEWLTILVNEGIFGLVMYGGLLVSAVVRMMKSDMARISVCGLAVLAYMINSMFSFRQVMGTATLFVILGMGEAYLRK